MCWHYVRYQRSQREQETAPALKELANQYTELHATDRYAPGHISAEGTNSNGGRRVESKGGFQEEMMLS